MVNVNYQPGIFKTEATYQTSQAGQDAYNTLYNAIIRCKYKILQKTPQSITFKTPFTFIDYGFRIKASLNHFATGTVVKLEGKSTFPLYLDVYKACKKRIAALETYL